MLSKNILDSSYNLVYDNINRSANNVERVRIRGSTEYFDTQCSKGSSMTVEGIVYVFDPANAKYHEIARNLDNVLLGTCEWLFHFFIFPTCVYQMLP